MKSVYLLLFMLCVRTRCVRDTGNPAGLMSDCPGMGANTTLSEKTRNSLRVVVLYSIPALFRRSEVMCPMDDAGADCVAAHLDLLTDEIVIFTSGYMDASFSPLTRIMAAPYLEHGKKIIVMELFPVLVKSYPISARLTKPLGVVLGKFLVKLTDRGLSPSRVTMVGGSLGAHIGSFAATKYYEITGRKISRLTGLDPAGPCFRNLPARRRFNPGAALRVDALHTNIDGFGIADAVAHIDYYANGGEFQAMISGGFVLPCFQLCSHVRSAFYWLGALNNPDKFVAVRCKSVADVRQGDCYDEDIVTNVLGPYANFSRPGIYYLPTLEGEPFYMGKKGLQKRKFGINNYLLKATKEEDLIV